MTITIAMFVRKGKIMGKLWYVRYKFPITLPTGPIEYYDPMFEELLVRTKIYDDVDKYIDNIEKQHGTFWISSPGGGYGKSTLLNYIARRLYLELNKLRVLPFYITIKLHLKPLEKAFMMEFLENFLQLDRKLRELEALKLIHLPDDLKDVIYGEFRRFRPKIRNLIEELPRMSVETLGTKFYKALECLRIWLKRGIFRKYVLLIDEMDKLYIQEALDFLARNQFLFQKLYHEYRFVSFISGHRSWVERVRGGTEYSFFRGVLLEVPTIVDYRDVQKLVESRLLYYAEMSKGDVPFNEDAYRRIQKLSGGIPRNIILLAQDAINEAYEKKVEVIGAGIVDEVFSKGKLFKELREFFESKPETYMKIWKAIENDVYWLLALFYEVNPEHKILKRYDKDINERTRYLAVEVSDEEWNEAIETLSRYGCIEERKGSRTLVSDVVAFFDILRRNQVQIRNKEFVKHVLSKLKAKIKVSKKPNFLEAIDRAFRTRPYYWYTKEELYRWFRDSAEVLAYGKGKILKDEEVKNIFNKWFKEYIKKKRSSLIVIEENGIKYYRRRPKDVQEEEIKTLEKSGSKDLIDEYLTSVYGKEVQNIVQQLDELLEKVIILLGERRKLDIKRGFLRSRRRYKIFRDLGIPDSTKACIESYIRLTKKGEEKIKLARELCKDAVLDIIRSMPKKATLRDEQAYKLLGQLEGKLRELIERELSKVSRNWWKERVPKDVRENAEKRREQEKRTPGAKVYPIKYYLDFSDYIKIICRRDNWRDAFKKYFKDVEWISTRLKELQIIRNKIAHYKPLSERDKDKLALFVKEILECIE